MVLVAFKNEHAVFFSDQYFFIILKIIIVISDNKSKTWL